MSIEAIGALNAATTLQTVQPLNPATHAGFTSLLDGLQGLNQQMQANDQSTRLLALGETDNLHQVMMKMERTRLEFELLLQVRNKALEAYQELMRMQV